MDAVIVWTDTEGKDYRNRQLEYINETESISGTGRSQIGMLLTLAGILRYAPVSGLILVCGHEPSMLKAFLKKNFPERMNCVRIVSHNKLFEGFEGFLPCFSDTAIMTLIYRIPGLSDEFLLFSPGCMPLGPMSLDVFRKKKQSIIFGRVKKRGKVVARKVKTSPPALLPVLIRRKELESSIADCPGLLSNNLRSRFNSPLQTDILSLLVDKGKAVACFHGPGTMVLRPGDDQSFSKLLSRGREFDYLSHSPLTVFPEPQKIALIDFLCAWLEIHIP